MLPHLETKFLAFNHLLNTVLNTRDKVASKMATASSLPEVNSLALCIYYIELTVQGPNEITCVQRHWRSQFSISLYNSAHANFYIV